MNNSLLLGQVVYRAFFSWLIIFYIIFYYISSTSVLVKHPEPRTPQDIYNVIPSGNNFLTGLYIVDIAVILSLPSNFVLLITLTWAGESTTRRSVIFGIIGGLDLALAILLMTGIILQEEFLPSTLAACQDAFNWNNGTDGRNYFVELNMTSNFESTYSPNQLCSTMVNNVIVSIVIMIFFSACATVNLGIALSHIVGGAGASRKFMAAFDSWWGCFFFPCSPLLPLVATFAYFYNHTLAPIRFACRYMLRYMGYMAANAPSSRWRAPWILSLSNRTANEEKVLAKSTLRLPNDVIIRISRQLHHADLVNLSRSSKALRWRFFGHQDTKSSLAQLRRQTCGQQPNKMQCSICDTQVCSGCRKLAKVPKSNAYRHLTQCRSVCSGCYYERNCVFNFSNRFSRPRRTRWDIPRDLEVLGGTYNNGKHNVCRVCAAMSPEMREKMLEERDIQELQRLARLPLACFTCKAMLPETGIRWWLDMRVGKDGCECTWKSHPLWVQNA